jgi:glycosyltransferase involved in cell wall biosynthesis
MNKTRTNVRPPEWLETGAYPRKAKRAMLSVIIPTMDSERALVPTLAALVSGATAGLIREVLIVDGGSRDDTAAVADVAGCNFRLVEGLVAYRLKTGAASARAPWLLFLRPGTVLDEPWSSEVRQFVEQGAPVARAAAFRRGGSGQPGLREAWSLVAAAFGAKPGPQQGLIISKGFYQQIGGHTESAADPERDLVQRIGRRRIVTLSSSAVTLRDT